VSPLPSWTSKYEPILAGAALWLAVGLAVEAAPDELPDGVVDTPLPWEARALIAMMATTTAPIPARAFRTRCLFLRGPRGGCGP
jgi:hypothetical protein